MKANYCLTDDAIGVFAINLRFNLDDIQTIASEAITGGGDDKKCDVVYVDKEREIAVIAQCYMSPKQRPAAPSNKAADLNTALTWLSRRTSTPCPILSKAGRTSCAAPSMPAKSNSSSSGMSTTCL